MKEGKFIDLFKYQIGDLIKIWYLPELFQVNGLSSQNPYVSFVQCRGQFMWIQLHNLNPLASSSTDNPINIHNDEQTDKPMEMSDD